MTATVTLPNVKRKRLLSRLICFVMMCVTMSVTCFASGTTSGTMESAISDVQTSLTGVIGYISGVTSALLGNDLWLLGMGFFVLLFIAGFVMYLFRVGRR